jgi:hypothetical protein
MFTFNSLKIKLKVTNPKERNEFLSSSTIICTQMGFDFDPL